MVKEIYFDIDFNYRIYVFLYLLCIKKIVNIIKIMRAQNIIMNL